MTLGSPHQANICGRNSLSPPRHSLFFCSVPFSKFRTERYPLQQKEGADTVAAVKVCENLILYMLAF